MASPTTRAYAKAEAHHTQNPQAADAPSEPFIPPHLLPPRPPHLRPPTKKQSQLPCSVTTKIEQPLSASSAIPIPETAKVDDSRETPLAEKPTASKTTPRTGKALPIDVQRTPPAARNRGRRRQRKHQKTKNNPARSSASPNIPEAVASRVDATFSGSDLNKTPSILSPPRPFSNYLDKSTGRPTRLPPGVSVTESTEMKPWRVWTVNLYKSNITTFCINYLTGRACNKTPCRLEHNDELRRAVRRPKAEKSRSNGKPSHTETVAESSREREGQQTKTTNFLDLDTANHFSTGAATVPPSDFVSLPRSDDPPQSSGTAKKISKISKCQTYAAALSGNLPKPVTKTPVKHVTSKKRWDQGELTSWAQRNLSPGTMTKMMVRYLDAGEIPPHLQPSKKRKGKTFLYFTLLPGEIRNIIWHYAFLLDSSDVMVRYDPKECAISHLQNKSPFLYVNRECRSLAELHWPLRFRTPSSPAHVRIHFRSDRLFVHNTSANHLLPMIESLSENDRHSIFWVAIPLRDWVAEHVSTLLALCHCANVQKVWFVVGTGNEDMNFVEEFYRGVEGLQLRLQKELERAWKQMWKGKKPAWVVKKVPEVEFKFVHAFEAKGMGIDELRWM